jgi:hypothetical protein
MYVVFYTLTFNGKLDYQSLKNYVPKTYQTITLLGHACDVPAYLSTNSGNSVSVNIYLGKGWQTRGCAVPIAGPTSGICGFIAILLRTFTYIKGQGRMQNANH